MFFTIGSNRDLRSTGGAVDIRRASGAVDMGARLGDGGEMFRAALREAAANAGLDKPRSAKDEDAAGSVDDASGLTPAGALVAAKLAAANVDDNTTAAGAGVEAVEADTDDDANGDKEKSFELSAKARQALLAGLSDRERAGFPDSDPAAQEAFWRQKTEKLLAGMGNDERERFLAATPARQDAYIAWKQHSLDVRKGAEEFAGFFFGFMMKEMRSTVNQGELGHGGKGEKLFQELMDEETGKNIAAGDRSGLVDMLQQSLSGPPPFLGKHANAGT